MALLNGEELNEDFVKLYDLSPRQVDQLKGLFAATKTRLERVAATNASIVAKGEGEFVISIPPALNEGGRVYSDMLEAVRTVLGEERYAIYVSLLKEGQSTAFGNFGLGEVVINLKPSVGTNGTDTATASVSTDPETFYVRQKIETTPRLFKTQYPELFKKMVAEGLWNYAEN